MSNGGGLLAVRQLRVRYGAVEAVRGVDLDVHPGEIVALPGANGAGKSSILDAVMGLVPPSGGRVILLDEDVTGRAPEHNVRRGMTLCPEGRHVFGNLTVEENLAIGATTQRGRARGNNAIAETRGRMLELFPALSRRLDQAAGTLSGGEQQMLSLARAMMSAPRLLLLDEPSLGLAPQVVDTIFELVARLRERGLTILLVEQNVELALEIADRGYVLAAGRVVLAGRAGPLVEADEVVRAYLGTG